jgi:hypothetical protein
MMLSAHIVYRPTMTSDGEGGSTEATPLPIQIYGSIFFTHENEPRMYVNAYTDVRVGDIIEVEEDE